MRYLTTAEILEVAEGHVGTYHLLDESRLHYLVEAVKGKFGDTELYPTLFQKAAVYAHHIVTGHIFLDGNKRTGLHCAILFLEFNGCTLRLDINDSMSCHFYRLIPQKDSTYVFRDVFIFFLPPGVCRVLFGIYHLQAASQPQEIPPLTSPTPQQREVTETRGTLFSASIDSDFYQTIIRNNLFAPLGTVLNPKPVPGANLKLLGTFVSASNPLALRAWIQDTRTGDYRTLVVTDSIHGFMLTEIQAEQVRLEKADETITLKLETGLFLNPQRR